MDPESGTPLTFSLGSARQLRRLILAAFGIVIRRSRCLLPRALIPTFRVVGYLALALTRSAWQPLHFYKYVYGKLNY